MITLNDLEKLKKKYPDRQPDTNLHIGAYSYGKPTIINYSSKSTVEIGKFCSIADNVKIILGGEHRYDWITTYPFSVLNGRLNQEDYKDKGDVVIGSDVWVGYGATILGGVTIGDGAVIGAECVVAKDVPSYSVFVGNPGRVIKKRFWDLYINFLLDFKWWDLPEDKLVKVIPFLESDDISGLIDYYLKELV
jgi:acetyltransferase-like isoleucine patch superfamily enzyme